MAYKTRIEESTGKEIVVLSDAEKEWIKVFMPLRLDRLRSRSLARCLTHHPDILHKLPDIIEQIAMSEDELHDRRQLKAARAKSRRKSKS